MRLRWSSIGGQTDAGLVATTVNRYDSGGVHWCAFVALQPLLDEDGLWARFPTEAAARAAAEEAWLEREIADLDASVADPDHAASRTSGRSGRLTPRPRRRGP